MDQRTLLKKTVSLARTGNAEAFQNFYILTIEETYGKLRSLVKEEALAEELLVDIYVGLWNHVNTLPAEEEELTDRMEEEIYRIVEKKTQEELERSDFDGDYQVLKEETAALMWMKIEEQAEFNREEPEEENISFTSYLYSVLKVAATVLILIFTAVVFYKGWHWFNDKKMEQEIPAAVIEPALESSESSVVTDSEKLIPGWEQKPDGNLYYVTHSGSLADGPVALGKQILTFSRSGELTMIGSNKAVVENMNLTFDEEIGYEVKDGDIYRRDPETGNEVRIVMNGHVVQADIRCGYLWFISQYTKPNSSQVKTTIYRASADGENQVEIYTTDSTLETQNFQVTSRWLYYLADGSLFRKELDAGTTEYLAGDVEYYFAWEDTAYYMKDRGLERVSQGSDYKGIEAGYRIELREQGLVLLDEFGNPVMDDDSGEIQAGDRIYRMEEGVIRSVRPAPRTNGDVLYYIEDAGSDRKIYWEDGTGTRGLIRQEGLAADSFCIAGEYLYYSARTEQYGEECDSQIYRLSLHTMELEPIGAPFRGFMKNLYYFDNIQAIFGEYIPSVADPADIHGEIAMISPDGGIDIVNDMGTRPESDGSDMLEIVMAEGDRIFCLYHRLSYDGLSGQIAWETTIPMEIRYKHN